MTDLERFRKAVERFIKKNKIWPTQFGIMFARDPKFVFQLRAGREPRTSTQQSILEKMKTWKPEEEKQ